MQKSSRTGVPAGQSERVQPREAGRSTTIECFEINDFRLSSARFDDLVHRDGVAGQERVESVDCGDAAAAAAALAGFGGFLEAGAAKLLGCKITCDSTRFRLA